MAKKYVHCSWCHGTGTETCDRCHGTGKVSGRVNPNRTFTCSKCGGSGTVSCRMCNGFGNISTEDEDD